MPLSPAQLAAQLSQPRNAALRAPAVFLPYQQKVWADQSQVVVVEKSRRTGLSWSAAGWAVLAAAAAKGTDVWYMGYTFDMAREFMLDCADFCGLYQIAVGKIDAREELFTDGDEDKAVLTYSITFASGFRVCALSSNPRNLRSKQGVFIWDEAAFHSDFSGVMKAALALLVWGGRVVIISTHFGVDNPFNQLVLDIHAGQKPYSLHRIDFDDALSQGLYQRMCAKKGEPWSALAEAEYRKGIFAFYGDNAQEELLCIPAHGSGSWLSRGVLEQCMICTEPVLRWAQKNGFSELPEAKRTTEAADYFNQQVAPRLLALPRNARHFVGVDFGRSGDLTVVWVVTQTVGLGLATALVLELRNIPFEQQKQLVALVGTHLPLFSGAALDASGNGAYLAEVTAQTFGSYRVQQIKLSQDWYRQQMPYLKAELENQRISLPRDADVLADLRLLAMDKGVAKVPDNVRSKGLDGFDRHGDSAIALALCVFAARTIKAIEIDFTPVALQQTHTDSSRMRMRPQADADNLVQNGSGW